jgi:hypothetical protein
VTTYTFLMDYRVAAQTVGEAERKGPQHGASGAP